MITIFYSFKLMPVQTRSASVIGLRFSYFSCVQCHGLICKNFITIALQRNTLKSFKFSYCPYVHKIYTNWKARKFYGHLGCGLNFPLPLNVKDTISNFHDWLYKGIQGSPLNAEKFQFFRTHPDTVWIL